MDTTIFDARCTVHVARLQMPCQCWIHTHTHKIHMGSNCTRGQMTFIHIMPDCQLPSNPKTHSGCSFWCSSFFFSSSCACVSNPSNEARCTDEKSFDYEWNRLASRKKSHSGRGRSGSAQSAQYITVLVLSLSLFFLAGSVSSNVFSYGNTCASSNVCLATVRT